MKEEIEVKSNPTPLAIIGLACIFPKAENLAEYWSLIKNRVDAITEVPETHWRVEDFYNENPKAPDMTYARRGGFISPVDFNPLEFAIAPNVIEATDTSQLLGLVVAQKALEDAGYLNREFDRSKTSVILGVTGTLELVIPLGARLGHPRWKQAMKDCGAGEEFTNEVVKRISDSYVGWQELSFPGLLGNVVAGRIANHLDLGGTNCVCDAACGSSLSALNLAALELESGRNDMVLTGGVDTFNDIFMYMCFSKTPALSPTGNARPFDLKCDGTIIGEGLGMVVIKRLEDAERAGDKIYAVIRSVGTSSDGKGAAIFAPKADGQKRALLKAYSQADISPRTIELLEAHGTGTKVGDITEISALNEVFMPASDDKQWCAIGSVKSQIGHTKAAAGVAGLIKTSLGLYHKVLPPTIKVDQPMEVLAEGDTPFYVNTVKRPWMSPGKHPRRAAVSCFGFGGSNYHTILEEHISEKLDIDWDHRVQIMALSAKSIEQLKTELSKWPSDISRKDIRARADIARVLFNSDDPFRLVIVYDYETQEIGKVLNNARTMLEKNAGKPFWSTPDGIYFGSGKPSGKLGVLFPGQGSQYVGMQRDLFCQFPQAHNILAGANESFSHHRANGIEKRLVDLIYPPPGFDEETYKKQEAELRDTRVAQPSLGATSLGALQILNYFGISSSAYAGHSYGELTALCAAGRLTHEELHRLSALRGNLMAGRSGDLGSMLAVQAEISKIEEVLQSTNLNLVLANKNTPTQGVLSGVTPEIDRAAEVFTGLGFRNTKIPVAAAFHSPVIADAQAPFAQALEDIAFPASEVPVYSNTFAAGYPEDSGEARTILAGQLARPVEFVNEIKAMYEAGIRTFVEVGPGARLTGMVKAILGTAEDFQALALDASQGKKNGILDLAKTLANTAALGFSIKLGLWDPLTAEEKAELSKPKPKITISICGANYVKPAEKKPPVNLFPEPQAQRPAAIPGSGPAATNASTASVNPAIAEALQLTQQNLLALQTLQEQNALLHQQFLANQDATLRSYQALLGQQQGVLQSYLGFAPQAAGSFAKTEQALTPVQMLPAQAPAVPSLQTSAQMLQTQALFRAEPVQQNVTMQPTTEGSAKTEPQVKSVAATVSSADEGSISGVLLEIVSEKTGYPMEMLEMGMTLDSDLGIDSIKRVEIFSALQDKLPGASPVRPEHLGSLKTLQDIAGHIAENMQPVTVPSSKTSEPSVPQVSSEQVTGTLLELVAEKTGYPVEMLELNMSLDSDLGIDSIKRVEIFSALQDKVTGLPPIKPDQMGTLKTLQNIADFISSSSPSASSAAAPEKSVPSPAAQSSTYNSGQVSEILLQLVAEKTGYPVEMLEMDMNLDSDLGIDSIKRVEIFSALQDKLPGMQPIKPDQLGTLKTLKNIAEFIGNSAGKRTGAVSDQSSSVNDKIPALDKQNTEIHTQTDVNQVSSESEEDLPEGNQLQRWIVTSKQLPATDNRKPLALLEGREIWISDDGSDLARNIQHKLQAYEYKTRLVSPESGETLSVPELLGGLIIVSPANVTDSRFLKDSFALLKKTGRALQEAGKKDCSFFATVSRLNGRFGLDGLTAEHCPLSGGLAGLTKTASHEWPEVACKAIDLALNIQDIEQAISDVIEEIFLSGPREVGITSEGRFSVELAATPLETAEQLPFTSEDVVIITGGARGVTAECAVTLAKTCKDGKPTLVLLGRSKQPSPEPEWLKGLVTENEIKRELMKRAGNTATLKVIGEQYHSITANREMLSTLDRIEATGVKAVYRSVDVRNVSELTAVIDEIRSDFGRIRGLIHGAGVLADKYILEKTADEFEKVYDTKVIGLLNLLNILHKEDLKVLALFSSSTGRFGRTGQVDYAVANEVLNKIAQQQSALYPACRVVSINWGPWDGGMVTPSLKKLFEQEGISVIPLAAGARHLVMAISSLEKGAVETVVMGPADTRSDVPEAVSPQLSIAVERVLTLDEYPFLASHVMDGKAVLPVAMMIEWLAYGAMHGNPGLPFFGFNDFRVLKGIKLEDQTSYTYRILTGKAVKKDVNFHIPVELVSSSDGRNFDLNARTEIILSSKVTPDTKAITPGALLPYPHQNGDMYSKFLFHGLELQGIREIEGWSAQGIAGIVTTAPKPSAWIKKPLRSNWIADPLALDCSFQMMILWSFEKHGAGNLPCYIGSYRQFKGFPGSESIRTNIRITSDNGSKARSDIEFTDGSDNLIARMENYECIIDSSLGAAFSRNVIDRNLVLSELQ